jgi:tetratricopeptide (TPR) repeat protein
MSSLVPPGRLDEALEEMLTAQSLDPVSSIVARDLALVYLFRREPESALEQCDHAIELNSHFSPAYWALGLIQEQRQDFDEAAAAFQRAIHLSPNTPRMRAGLVARTQALAGRRKEPSIRCAGSKCWRISATCHLSSSRRCDLRLVSWISDSVGSPRLVPIDRSSCCGCASTRGWIM